MAITVVKVPEGWVLWNGQKAISGVYASQSSANKARDCEVVKPQPAEQRMRKCLTCRAEFLSWGPGNRMCTHCRAHAASLDNFMVGR